MFSSLCCERRAVGTLCWSTHSTGRVDCACSSGPGTLRMEMERWLHERRRQQLREPLPRESACLPKLWSRGPFSSSKRLRHPHRKSAVWPLSWVIAARSSGGLAAASASAPAASPRALVLWRRRLSLHLVPPPLPAPSLSPAASSPLSAFTELEGQGPALG